MNNSKSSWFSYEELANATNGFSARNVLGEGGFGCVYKEVEIISRIQHRHLVCWWVTAVPSTTGCSSMITSRIIPYIFISMTRRVKVAAGAARGIAYLHEDCHPRIIYQDIKSLNILLDANFEAQVADFGLTKLAIDTSTHITTRVVGTFRYMASEYATSGKLTEKSDVYSFGVVLLELITGRKPVDASQPLGDESLVEWARPLLVQALEDGNFEGLVDTRLENNFVEVEIFRMIEAATACVCHSAAKRPSMSQVPSFN
ncbi:hypothetical protein MLD38_033830 [Melastoma candidum]|uniref:Uncharacterized protein n=1 Tax=Melastoma candidum TaxID=119954 RepID=A0ACB9MAM4_9MYRT|nr:hypothetical protein MLD38_033830 [Melastoma candidum]